MRVVEWIGANPSCECRSILVAKAPLEKLRRFGFAIELGGEPTTEGIAIVDSFLSCQSGKAFGGNPEPTCLGVLLRAVSGPFCCLITAPSRGHSDEGKDHGFDNFNRFKTGLRSVIALVHLV